MVECSVSSQPKGQTPLYDTAELHMQVGWKATAFCHNVPKFICPH